MNLSESICLQFEEILDETTLAWQIRVKNEIYWFPKSQCRIINKFIYVPKWLVDQKEIIYNEESLTNF